MQTSAAIVESVKRSCGLLSLPTELRLEIFKKLFQSTTANYGFGTTSSTNASILTTCHQIYEETKDLLLPNITFNFRSTATLLDYLIADDRLPLSEKRVEFYSKMRYMRVKAFPLPVHDANDDECTEAFYTHFFPRILPLFKGMRLQRLTVEDCWHENEAPLSFWGNRASHGQLYQLLEEDGWKELHYIIPTAQFLTTHWPGRWAEVLLDRDGINSGASVEMFVAAKPNVRGAAYDLENSTKWNLSKDAGEMWNLEKEYFADSCSEGFADSEDDQPIPEDSREVLIVARRGKDSAITQHGTRLVSHIKRLFEKWTWSEMKERGTVLDGESDPDGCL